MNILAIDTSCDETAVAVTADTKIVSSTVWSQSSLHSSFGGVFPSLAQREHQARIDFVLNKALTTSKLRLNEIDAIAVTVGPGLAVALGVGIEKAIEIATKYKKPLIPVNHVEAHLLSPFAVSKNQIPRKIDFPALGLILSGGTTLLCKIEAVGKYQVLAKTVDDALGEALDKGARLLGLGYPGGPVLEKMARLGSPKYKLPIPLIDDHIRDRFSYSGLKTAFVRLHSGFKKISKEDIYDLASSFQETAFKHIAVVLQYHLKNYQGELPKSLLFGGGVVNNVRIRQVIRNVLKPYGIKLEIPYNKKLMGDNAGMIGVCAYLKNKDADLTSYYDYTKIDRIPSLSL